MGSPEELGTSGDSSVLNRSREFDPVLTGRIELRIGELEKDAEELARLFSQSSTLPHLSGIAPRKLAEDEMCFFDNQQSKYPFSSPVITATPEGIRRHYEMNKGSFIPIVAEDPKDKGKLLGSVTVINPGAGIIAASVSRLVVDEKARGRGLGSSLVKAANEYVFSKGYWQASAGIILDVPGDEGPLKIFGREGYESRLTEPNRCISWDSNAGIFKVRNVLLVVLHKDAYRNSQGTSTFIRRD